MGHTLHTALPFVISYFTLCYRATIFLLFKFFMQVEPSLQIARSLTVYSILDSNNLTMFSFVISKSLNFQTLTLVVFPTVNTDSVKLCPLPFRTMVFNYDLAQYILVIIFWIFRYWGVLYPTVFKMRIMGFEPIRLSAQEPKSCTSANSIISALVG